jgi:hypothetical protein
LVVLVKVRNAPGANPNPSPDEVGAVCSGAIGDGSGVDCASGASLTAGSGATAAPAGDEAGYCEKKKSATPHPSAARPMICVTDSVSASARLPVMTAHTGPAAHSSAYTRDEWHSTRRARTAGAMASETAIAPRHTHDSHGMLTMLSKVLGASPVKKETSSAIGHRLSSPPISSSSKLRCVLNLQTYKA